MLHSVSLSFLTTELENVFVEVILVKLCDSFEVNPSQKYTHSEFSAASKEVNNMLTKTLPIPLLGKRGTRTPNPCENSPET